MQAHVFPENPRAEEIVRTLTALGIRAYIGAVCGHHDASDAEMRIRESTVKLFGTEAELRAFKAPQFVEVCGLDTYHVLRFKGDKCGSFPKDRIVFDTTSMAK